MNKTKGKIIRWCNLRQRRERLAFSKSILFVCILVQTPADYHIHLSVCLSLFLPPPSPPLPFPFSCLQNKTNPQKTPHFHFCFPPTHKKFLPSITPLLVQTINQPILLRVLRLVSPPALSSAAAAATTSSFVTCPTTTISPTVVVTFIVVVVAIRRDACVPTGSSGVEEPGQAGGVLGDGGGDDGQAVLFE